MTQAPTPGPLSASDVKMLVKGDLLRRTDGAVGQFERLSISGLVVWNPYREKRDPHEILSFIGRPDESGWMPWSGGGNPVGEAVVDTRHQRGDECSGWVAAQWGVSWLHEDPEDGENIIAFRLAPTAPVEASGSERVSDAIRAKYEKVKATTYRAGTPAERMKEGKLDGLNTALAVAMVAEDRLDALRPQPSGETREAVARLVDPDAWIMIDHWRSLSNRPDLDQRIHERQQPSLVAADAILALLSARPLASGGQHSTLIDFPPDDVLACVESQHSSGEGEQ